MRVPSSVDEQVVQVRLVVVEEREARRLEVADLARDLRSDRPAGAGDQDAPASQELSHGGEVRLDLLSAQEVLDPQVDAGRER